MNVLAFRDDAALARRAASLSALGMNGIRRVLVSLAPATAPTEAHLDVTFYENASGLATRAAATSAQAVFPISGGHRLRAGPAVGEVQVTAVQAGSSAEVLRLVVQPIGDYSTYTLSVTAPGIDPVFGGIDFKFRPGCFSIDCDLDWEAPPRPVADPAIDYLVKDYDSFRHTLLAAIAERVPGWRPTSDADLTVALVGLIAAAADELSDYQDRVMNEAYLATARSRVSLARHARLVDYHIHQGNQAATILALRIDDLHNGDQSLDREFVAWTGAPGASPGITFVPVATDRPVILNRLLDRIGLYTWGDTCPALAAGATTADLEIAGSQAADAAHVEAMIRSGKVNRLLLQEELNPLTGDLGGRDPQKRQILRLLPGLDGARALLDPVPGAWLVRVRWRDEDRLRHDYCFTETLTNGRRVTGVSLFHGNLVDATAGATTSAVFREPGTELRGPDDRWFRRTDRWGTLCGLPEDRPVAYRATPADGTTTPRSSLAVTVEEGGASSVWEERISLVHSRATDRHFAVETDELARSVVRFGNGQNGLALPDGAVVHCVYQSGDGLAGNVGADQVIRFKTPLAPVVEVWNPFHADDGRGPEPVARVLRNAPEAYRAHQLRAVTLADYVRRAEEVPGVARAAAVYAWTGSWRTVRITIDAAGTTTLSDELRRRVANCLETYRLLGEDLEIRPPRYVPLTIKVVLCAAADVWPEDLRFAVAQEVSTGYTHDGRLAFFHPDRWTFGQPLHASEIAGRLQAIPGVEHIISLVMTRWNEATPGDGTLIEVAPSEIIQVENDPDHMETGSISVDIRGGQQ